MDRAPRSESVEGGTAGGSAASPEPTVRRGGTLVVMLQPVNVPGYGVYRAYEMARLERGLAQTLINDGVARKYREGLKLGEIGNAKRADTTLLKGPTNDT